MYLPGSNTLGFATNSSPALTITATGNVGIGTTSPGAVLDVHSSSNAVDTVRSLNSATTGTINAVEGQVSSTDAQASAVYGYNAAATGNGQGVAAYTASTGAGMGVWGEDGGTGNTGYGGWFSNTSGSGANYGVYGADASSSGYGGYFTNSSSGYGLYVSGNAQWSGVFVSNNNYTTSNNNFIATSPNLGTGNESYFNFGVNGSNNNWASLGFYYAGSGSTSNRIDLAFAGSSDVMSLLAGGYVGIGTTSPGAWLDIESSGNNELILGSSNTIGNSLQLNNSSAGAHNVQFFTTGSANTTGVGKFGFYDVTAATIPFIINSTGSVGIGTTSPIALLDVYGNSTAKDLTLGPWSGSSTYNAIYLNGLASTGNDYNILSSNSDQALYINTPTGYGIHFRQNNSEEMVLTSTGSVGIGTTSPSAALAVGGHVDTHQTAPGSLTGGCGAAATIAGTDTAMQITTSGSGLSTTCGATFNSTWTHAPVCVAERYNSATVVYLSSTTTSAFVVTQGSAFTAGNQIDVICQGYE